jgi:putative peptidoglycan lipid II flippase
VAGGIFASRLVGLVRQRVFGHYFGTSPIADAFNAAFRIPNLLQNLFGEGGLSASFIPVYSRLLAEGDEAGARRVAGGVAALLGLTVSAIVLLGVAGAPWLVHAVAGGFDAARLELTITLVRILFPGAGLLVMSAWCLGVLNSHRRFFVAYAAPMAWNAAIIAALAAFGARAAPEQLVVVAAWGSVVGSLLQVLVQLPGVRAVLGGLPLRLRREDPGVRAVVRGFGPALVSRGVVQLSAFVDLLIASYLPAGGLAALSAAQVIANLPVSLFGIAVSAAELPEMARGGDATPEATRALRTRLEDASRRIALGVVPSAAAFILLGGFVTAALFESGRFTADDSRYVWGILAASGVGLLASTLGRVYASALYALRDTVTPFRFALGRMALGTMLGLGGALLLPEALGLAPKWGAAGLVLGSGCAAWLEFALLKRAVDRRIGATRAARGVLVPLWGAAALGAGAGWAAAHALPPLGPLLSSALVLGAFGGAYAAGVVLFRVREAQSVVASVRRRLGGTRGP